MTRVPAAARALLLVGGTAALPAVASPAPGAPAVLSHVTGPPPAHTGGFGEPTCAVCHEGDDLNAFGGKVSILGLPAAYQPGTTYAVTVVLEAGETAVAGFQMAARFLGGDFHGRPAGHLEPLDPRVAVTTGETGQPYAHHTSEGASTADANGSSWLVEWRAPHEPLTVAFHVTANSGNGDNSPLLDLVYAAEVTVPPAPSGS